MTRGLGAAERHSYICAVKRRWIISVVVLFALFACRPRDATRAPSGAPFGTLVIAVPGDADFLLPPVATTQLAAHVTDRFFPRLAELREGLNTVDDSGFAPVVADRWERRDSLTIAFALDPRARWHDGTPITADDVVYSFGVYRDTLTASPYRINLQSIASVTREDSLTAVFRFHRAYPEQLYDATYHMRLIPKHALDTIPNDRLAASSFARDPAVGAGPFRFVRWESGSEITVEADTTWFRGAPRLARIVWRIMPDVSAAVTALLAGEADAMEVIPLRDEIERVRGSAELRLIEYPSPFTAGVVFNQRRPLFAERELRRAIARAIDRETIVRSVFGPYGEVPTGSTSRMVWIAQEPVRQLGYDTAAAAATLDSLGWRRGADGMRRRGGRTLSFTLIVPSTSRIRQEVSVLLQEQLRRAGIELRIETIEYVLFERRTHTGSFEAAFFSRTLDPSPAVLAQFWHSSAVNADNLGGYQSTAFDSLLAAATSARGRADALPLWRRALELLNEDAPAVHLYSLRNNAAIHTRLENVTIRPDSWLATVSAWSVAPDRRLPRDR